MAEGRTVAGVGTVAAAANIAAELIHQVLNVKEAAIPDVTGVGVAGGAGAAAVQHVKEVIIIVVVAVVIVIVVGPGGAAAGAHGATEGGRKAAEAVLKVLCATA